jgi:alkaline phosphatase D
LVMWAPLPDASATITKIAFGSCSRQDVPQPYWDTLSLRYQPDLVVLIGDNVYGDCQDLDCTHLRQAYVDLSQHASFQGAAERLPIVATLDDHDYGQGDCHADNPYKDVARQMFLDFYHIDSSQLPFSGDSAESSERDDGGVYRSYSWGPRGRRIQLIMLDTRYSRSPFVETGITNAPYEPYPNGTPSGSYQMLSGAQWTWLQDLLSVKDVDLTVLVSSIQVLNDQVVWEGWRHLPSERERLLRLLGDCGRPTIVVSGDRHVGGLYKVDGLNDEEPGGAESSNLFYSTLYEATASSWTHTIPLGAFGSNCTTSQTCDELDPTREGDLVRENHFGSIDIDWDSRSFSVSLRRTELSPDLLSYQRDVPSNAGEVIASFKDLKLLALS